MLNFTEEKRKVRDYMDKMAPMRDYWIEKNEYYYKDLLSFLKFNIPEGSSVMEIGCGTGYLLNGLNPRRGLGIDLSFEMISIASAKYKDLEFIQMDAEEIEIEEKFEFIIISDTVGYFEDVQKAFQELQKVSTPDTRIIITYHNFLWHPFLALAESSGLKMSPKKLNWLNLDDIANLLSLSDFDIIKKGRRFIFPKFMPLVSDFFNRYIAYLPFFNDLCLTGYIIARPFVSTPVDNDLFSVTIVIPARNEKGNIENAIKRMPHIGKNREIIFVEGHSTDNTLEEIKRVCEKYSGELDVKYTVQDGTGKGDAVRKGFSIAKGDIFIILDADLTVPPEDLPKFYNAISTGKGEYINGSRLVYPMEKEAMRTLNMIGNKFFSIMFTWLLGQKLKDTLCGTKAISKKNYEKLMSNRHYFGDFDPFGDFDLIFGSSKLNLKFIEVPIRYKARRYGFTNISRFKHGWLLLKMVFFAMNKIKFI
jgi:SAM-dependent methyltransferase